MAETPKPPAPHQGPEMALIILAVEDARKKDEDEAATILANRKKARDQWNKSTDKERQVAIKEGRAFVEPTKAPVRKWTRAVRRQIRYKIFRLREGKWAEDQELAALKSWYELQFQHGWTWKDFTFKWDVSAVDPLKAVTPIEWDGDVVSERVGADSSGKFCDPAAFTNQEM